MHIAHDTGWLETLSQMMHFCCLTPTAALVCLGQRRLPILCLDSVYLYDQKVFLSRRSLSPSAVADPSSFVRSSSHTSFDTHSLPRRPQKGRVSTLEDDPTKVPLL